MAFQYYAIDNADTTGQKASDTFYSQLFIILKAFHPLLKNKKKQNKNCLLTVSQIRLTMLAKFTEKKSAGKSNYNKMELLYEML